MTPQRTPSRAVLASVANDTLPRAPRVVAPEHDFRRPDWWGEPVDLGASVRRLRARDAVTTTVDTARERVRLVVDRKVALADRRAARTATRVQVAIAVVLILWVTIPVTLAIIAGVL